MNKDEIRRHVRNRKTLLNETDRISAAERVFAILEQTAEFMLASNILMYHSLPDELSTREFIDKWSSRKHFFLPRVNGVNLDILPYDRQHLALGSFHIEEPTGDETVSIDDIELIITPGVAYDRRGGRLGRGKGYYDRLLAGSKAVKIGVGYDFQLVDEIPQEPHDVRMDAVITESGYIVIRRTNRH